MSKIFWLFKTILSFFNKPQTPFAVINVTNSLPWHKTRTWSKRSLKSITKIIVHQELAMGSIQQVNTYHITPGKQNHLSSKGAPHFAYHYGIDLDGQVYKVNAHSATTWHCKGQNSSSIGILVAGNFTGGEYKGTTVPTAIQLRNLNFLLNKLLIELKLKDNDIYGHCEFSKPACPGNIIMNEIIKRRAV